jgi:hypothetical protein
MGMFIDLRQGQFSVLGVRISVGGKLTEKGDFLWPRSWQLQIHRAAFLPREHQSIRHESDKLCDTVNEI